MVSARETPRAAPGSVVWMESALSAALVPQDDANAAGPKTQTDRTDGDCFTGLEVLGLERAEMPQVEAQSDAFVEQADRTAADIVAEESLLHRQQAERIG